MQFRCSYCGFFVELEGDKWVTSMSGDDGGTYDICVSSKDKQHHPYY